MIEQLKRPDLIGTHEGRLLDLRNQLADAANGLRELAKRPGMHSVASNAWADAGEVVLHIDEWMDWVEQ